jgi:urea transporter
LLIALTEKRCPECGCPFDPNDRTSFRTRINYNTAAAWRVLIAWLIGCVIATAGVGMVLVILEAGRSPVMTAVAFGFNLMLVTAPLAIFFMARADRRTNPGWL